MFEEMKNTVDPKWLNQVMNNFPFEERLSENGFKFIQQKKEDNDVVIYYKGNEHERNFSIRVNSYGRSVQLFYLHAVEKETCISLKDAVYEYLIEQEDCPMKFMLFGKVEITYELPF